MPLLRGPINARPPAGAAPHSWGRRRKRAGLELLLRNPLFFLIFAVRVSQKFCRATLIYGSRYSLAIGFLAVGISVITGGILGVLAAYYPKLDNIIMRCMDLFMAIPQMLLAMCIVTALGSSLFNLMLAVGLSSTPKFARVVRAAVMSTREQEFVEAARAIGANNWRIIVHHILPNSISSLIVQATLAMAGAIISASALSFLGFGIQAPLPEWGAMLSTGRRYIRTEPYLTVIPGLAIMVVVYALNVVGDGLRDCLDPRLKK